MIYIYGSNEPGLGIPDVEGYSQPRMEPEI